MKIFIELPHEVHESTCYANGLFDDSGITETTSLNKTSWKWAAIKRWKKIGHYYVIYLEPNLLYGIAESAIPAQDMQAFESLLRNNIKKKIILSVYK